jgi:hypothetical protein
MPPPVRRSLPFGEGGLFAALATGEGGCQLHRSGSVHRGPCRGCADPPPPPGNSILTENARGAIIKTCAADVEKRGRGGARRRPCRINAAR